MNYNNLLTIEEWGKEFVKANPHDDSSAALLKDITQILIRNTDKVHGS